MYMLVKTTPKVTSSFTVRYVDIVFLKYLGQNIRRLHFYKYHNIQKQDKTSK